MRQLLAALCLLAAAGSLRAETVEEILARMDRDAPGFKGLSADIEMLTFTAILSDKTVENGTLKMQRLQDNDVRAILDFSKQTDPRVLAFLGKVVRVYYPKLKSYQDYQVGNNGQVLNQYLLLGFGSSGKELAQSYTITSEGSEKVAGADTTKLLLVPKDAKVSQRLAKVEVWVVTGASTPIQQQFYEPSGNYRRTTYSNMRINPPMHGTLDLKLPASAKKQS